MHSTLLHFGTPEPWIPQWTWFIDMFAAGDTMFSVFIRIPHRRVDANLTRRHFLGPSGYLSIAYLFYLIRKSPFHCPSLEQTCGNFTTFQFNWIPEALACTFLPHLHWLLYAAKHFSRVFLFMAATPFSKVILLHSTRQEWPHCILGMARFRLSCESELVCICLLENLWKTVCPIL